MTDFSSRHVGVAAEGFAAAMFARCGFDISVQYGANQPEYDLVVIQLDKVLKVSVKGSKDGSWGLTQSFIENADYHAAIDEWLRGHGPKTALCLVQFEGVPLDHLPRIYLATAPEVAAQLRSARAGRGDTILHEKKTWGPRAHAAGLTDEVPANWKFTSERVSDLLAFCM